MNRRTFLAAPGLGLTLGHFLSAESLKQGERDRMLSHFHATRKLFLDTVTPLPDAQWKWKPAADRWSIEEVGEHIALSEEGLYQMVLATLKKPVEAFDAVEQRKKDEIIIRNVPNRERKGQAPEFLVPRKSFPTKEKTIEAFLKARDRNITFVRETQEDLRAHLAPHPAFGPIDCYQWFLLISAHSERHVAQMKEVASLEGFPKS